VTPIVLAGTDLGEEDEVEVAQWLVPDGAHVSAGSPLVEVTTAKVTIEVPAPVAGTLRHGAQVGALVRAGEPIGWIVDG